jgi:DNA invertase Pin-like site-specific DNA recombinase
MNNRFVLYRRVSTARQGQSGLGLESQEETVRQYVASQHGTVVGEFVEVESGKHNDRPQLTLALNECRRLKATLVVAKLDRLSRNAEFLLRLQNGNIDFVCCDCPLDRFSVGIMALVAQRERELCSSRTKAALKAAKARGVRLGTRNPDRQVKLMMEGYRRENESFVSKVRPIIEEIRSAGVSSLKGIAECLTRRGIPTRTGKSVWWGSSVKCVLG